MNKPEQRRRHPGRALRPPVRPERRPADRGSPQGNGSASAAWLDERQRREMIATAAFLRAQRRGFDRGAELEDWLAAEAEIDRWLQTTERSDREPPVFEE